MAESDPLVVGHCSQLSTDPGPYQDKLNADLLKGKARVVVSSPSDVPLEVEKKAVEEDTMKASHGNDDQEAFDARGATGAAEALDDTDEAEEEEEDEDSEPEDGESEEDSADETPAQEEFEEVETESEKALREKIQALQAEKVENPAEASRKKGPSQSVNLSDALSTVLGYGPTLLSKRLAPPMAVCNARLFANGEMVWNGDLDIYRNRNRIADVAKLFNVEVKLVTESGSDVIWSSALPDLLLHHYSPGHKAYVVVEIEEVIEGARERCRQRVESWAEDHGLKLTKPKGKGGRPKGSGRKAKRGRKAAVKAQGRGRKKRGDLGYGFKKDGTPKQPPGPKAGSKKGKGKRGKKRK